MRAVLVAACLLAPAAFAAEHGQPTGVDLPNLLASASPALTEADGTLSWRVLADIRNIRRENTDGRYGYGIAYFLEPVVPEPVRALAGKKVRVRGYMLPRASEGGNSRFFVAALPAADADGCSAGGVENIVDIVLDGTVETKVDRVVTVEGTMTLFDAQSWNGYVYRLADARIIQQQ